MSIALTVICSTNHGLVRYVFHLHTYVRTYVYLIPSLLTMAVLCISLLSYSKSVQAVEETYHWTFDWRISAALCHQHWDVYRHWNENSGRVLAQSALWHGGFSFSSGKVQIRSHSYTRCLRSYSCQGTWQTLLPCVWLMGLVCAFEPHIVTTVKPAFHLAPQVMHTGRLLICCPSYLPTIGRLLHDTLAILRRKLTIFWTTMKMPALRLQSSYACGGFPTVAPTQQISSARLCGVLNLILLKKVITGK